MAKDCEEHNKEEEALESYANLEFLLQELHQFALFLRDLQHFDKSNT